MQRELEEQGSGARGPAKACGARDPVANDTRKAKKRKTRGARIISGAVFAPNSLG